MNIRKIQDADADSVIDLWRSVFPDGPPHNEPVQVLKAKLAIDDLVFVAEIESTIIGTCMAGYDGHRGWLYAVAVLPEQRRSGVGRGLVSHAIAALEQLGCRKINLQIRSSNTEVADFYQSLGFEIEDRMSMGYLIANQIMANK